MLKLFCVITIGNTCLSDVLTFQCIFHCCSDAELQRRRLKESRKGARLAEERLRQISFDLDDAGRALRRSRTQVQIAKDRLEELQDRHWALLCYYNPDQAEEKVAEALEEFQRLEPAARLDNIDESQFTTKSTNPNGDKET